jgi:hypothetical protein
MMTRPETWDDLSRHTLIIERMTQWRDSLEVRFSLLANAGGDFEALADELAAFRFCLEALYRRAR